MSNCLICNSSIEPFMSFGQMPIANGFLSPVQFADEYFYELQVAFCKACGMVQLEDPVEPEKMFHENYAFFSSTSAGMAAHFKQLANQVIGDHLRSMDPFVLEIGSNDGIMLQHVASAGIRHLGIEPSRNVAQRAKDKGIRTLSKFFNVDVAREILAENGPADVIMGANVMCHIPQLHSVIAGIKTLLKPKGLLIFEDPYLGDIVEKTSYDQIYDEHVFYFSLKSIGHLVNEHGLEIVDVIPLSVHGGSMRYVVTHQGTKPVSAAVVDQWAKEEALGLHRPKTYQSLRRNIEQSRDDLMQLLRDLKRQDKRVVGYGATSKSTTVTNYCGITSDLVEFISDTTPIKQGKFSPGTHIPVRPYEDFTANYPDYALLFAWNHATEIMAKEQKFRDAGGQWLVYVPRVEVVE